MVSVATTAASHKLYIVFTCLQCLVNKDKADEREENMSPEFYSKLVVAYRDPALSASQYSRDMSPEDPPLLRSYQS